MGCWLSCPDPWLFLPGATRGLGSMVPSGQAVEKPVTPEPELKSWRFLVSFLCFYGFMAQIRPGESFITPYLLGPKNFTRKQACAQHGQDCTGNEGGAGRAPRRETARLQSLGSVWHPGPGPVPVPVPPGVLRGPSFCNQDT